MYFKAKRFYKYNYSDPEREVVEELVGSVSLPLTIIALSKPERVLLEALSRGEKPGINYKIPIPCLANKYYRRGDRLYCTKCPYKPWCALPRNPWWFIRKTEYKREVGEIAKHNPVIAKVLGRKISDDST